MLITVALMAMAAALGCKKQAATPDEVAPGGTNQLVVPDEGRLKDARGFATLLGQEQFEAAAAMFEPALAKVMDAKKLETAWRASAKQRGAFRKIRDIRAQADAREATVLVTCEFEKAIMTLQVRFGPTGRVQTFYLQSGQR